MILEKKIIKRILIVDDSKFDSLFTKITLNIHVETDEIIIIHNPDIALKYLEKLEDHEMPNLILLDFHMPKTNGNAFLEHYNLSSLISKQNTIIILLTSIFYDKNKIGQNISTLFEKIIYKPFNYNAFKSILELSKFSIEPKLIS